MAGKGAEMDVLNISPSRGVYRYYIKKSTGSTNITIIILSHGKLLLNRVRVVEKTFPPHALMEGLPSRNSSVHESLIVQKKLLRKHHAQHGAIYASHVPLSTVKGLIIKDESRPKGGSSSNWIPVTTVPASHKS